MSWYSRVGGSFMGVDRLWEKKENQNALINWKQKDATHKLPQRKIEKTGKQFRQKLRREK